MYPQHVVDLALRLKATGLTDRQVALECGVSIQTVRHWRYGTRRQKPRRNSRTPASCAMAHDLAEFDRPAYAYLLGLYLGDGHIVDKRKQHTISIYCADAWPGLIDEAQAALRAVMPQAGTGRQPRKGCTEVKSYSMHWPCLFPQHGPGKKHERRIVLDAWQEAIVSEYPFGLIRGLIHSDGCRITNWTTRVVGGEVKRYEYPRYLFTNESVDIRNLYTDTLSSVCVPWRYTKRNTISVARREAVALLDQHVGPKY
jgi:transcriptional regulator with XRE-family HTH domain